MQANWYSILRVSTLYVIVLWIMKLHSHITSKEEIIFAMEDNSDETGIMKTKDVDEVIQLN